MNKDDNTLPYEVKTKELTASVPYEKLKSEINGLLPNVPKGSPTRACLTTAILSWLKRKEIT